MAVVIRFTKHKMRKIASIEAANERINSQIKQGKTPTTCNITKALQRRKQGEKIRKKQRLSITVTS